MTPHNLPTIGFDEQFSAAGVLRSGWLAQGAEVEAFEKELCDFFKLNNGHAVAVSSGSAALYLALWALDAGSKRIGLPVYSCSALRNAVGLANACAVYIDCAKGSPNIDPLKASNADIDILIAPSMFGIPVDLPVKPGFKIIEDIAQSLGSVAFGQPVGLRGDVGVCSFYATKMITSGGQGGAIISHDKSLINRIKDYREFDCRDDAVLRFNFQMTDLHAAIGRAQLKKLSDFVFQRQEIFSIYRDAGLDLFDSTSADNIAVRFRSVVRCSNPMEIIHALKLEGVRAIVPVEEGELLDKSILYPQALNLTRTSVSLPCYPSLQKNEALRIASIVKGCL